MFIQGVTSVLKWVRGDPLTPDHWIELFRLVGLPKGTTLEKLTFGQILDISGNITEKKNELKVISYSYQNSAKLYLTIYFSAVGDED